MALTKRRQNLPAKPAELRKWILIGKVKLRAQIAAIKAIKSLDEASAATQAALEDTQDLAEELLYAEAQMGTMLEAIPKSGKDQTSGRGSMVSLPAGVTHKESSLAQQLSKNEEVIAEVVAEAREKGEIPVRQKVLRQIAANKPKPTTPPLPKGKYNVVYADPPWKYGTDQHGKAGYTQETVIGTHYPSMDIQDICSLPVLDITATDCVLFLWATSPLLREAFAVVDSWGFEYKASFIWDTIKHNVGHYNSVRHEFLLICTRGSFMPETKTLYDSVVSIERTKHSEKPEKFREIIESLYPSGKKIELFARKQVKGWKSYGNDVGV